MNITQEGEHVVLKDTRKTFSTGIKAINWETGLLVDFAGPTIKARTKEEAQVICQTTGLGYCKVLDEMK